MELAVKRFYKTVSIQTEEDQHSILLDTKTLKSPAGNIISLPNHELAQKIANEFEVANDQVDFQNMPFYRLACGAVDYASVEKQAVLDDLLFAIDKDQTCYFEPSDQKLFEIQDEQFQPILQFIQKQTQSDVKTIKGIQAIEQNKEIKGFLYAYFEKMSPFSLLGIKMMKDITNSIFASYAWLEGHISQETLWSIARLDENYQADRWGRPPEWVEQDESLQEELNRICDYLDLMKLV